MNTNYTIYCHRNKINNKAYIGQTGMIPYTRRWEGHGVSGSPYKKCRHFQNAIEKYGWENFEHFVLMENLTLEEANKYEELLIALFDTTNSEKGYNISLGDNNHTHTEETKKKLSEATKGANNPMAKFVLCIETNQIFLTAKEAAEFVGVDKSTLCKAARGVTKTCKGYHWEYLTQEEVDAIKEYYQEEINSI